MSSASTHTPLPHLATFEDLLAIPDGERLHEVKKRRLYADHGVPHYWLVDTERERPIVLRLEKQGFVEVLEAGRGERVRAEPFGALEQPVGVLFGDDTDSYDFVTSVNLSTEKNKK